MYKQASEKHYNLTSLSKHYNCFSVCYPFAPLSFAHFFLQNLQHYISLFRAKWYELIMFRLILIQNCVLLTGEGTKNTCLYAITNANTFPGVGWNRVHLVRRPIFGLLYQPRMIDEDQCGTDDGMRTGRGNRTTRRKPAPVPLCPPQISHDMTWTRTSTDAEGNRRLTVWAMSPPQN
jgi:hypothetical protein